MSDSDHAGEKKEEQPSPASSLVSQTTNVIFQTPPVTPDIKPCGVCGDIKRTGNHYGAHSCGACGSDFFKRVVTGEKKIEGVCNEGNCRITPENKNGCEPCRYKACLAAGMQTGLVGKRRSVGATPQKEKGPEQVKTSKDSEVETIEKDVADLQEENKDRIDELENTVGELAERLDALESKVDTRTAGGDHSVLIIIMMTVLTVGYYWLYSGR